MTRIVALVVVANVAVGCGAGALNPNDYDHSCADASDCVAVSFSVSCNQGCGGGPDGAINQSSLAKLEQDAQNARTFCGPQFVVCAFEGGQDVVTTCENNVCGLAPAPTPPRDVSWVWTNPIAATTVPTNVPFRGIVSPGSDPAQQLTITLTVEGESAPRNVTIETDTAHCSAPSDCESVLDVGAPLPPHAKIAFHFTPSASEDDVSWTTGDGDDVTPPTVLSFKVSATGVAKSGDVLVKAIDLTATLPVDDYGLATIDVFRSIDGGEEQALDRLRPDFLQTDDQIPASSGAKRACYVLSATDWVGHVARAAPTCVDVVVSKAEAASLESGGCASTSNARTFPIALLALLSARRFVRRLTLRRRDVDGEGEVPQCTPIDGSPFFL